MIRLICIVVFLILYLILSIPVFLVEWLIGKFNPQARDISSLRIVQWGFKVILKMTGVKVTVIGEENIPDEPVLYVGNHRSFFDILPSKESIHSFSPSGEILNFTYEIAANSPSMRTASSEYSGLYTPLFSVPGVRTAISSAFISDSISAG